MCHSSLRGRPSAVIRNVAMLGQSIPFACQSTFSARTTASRDSRSKPVYAGTSWSRGRPHLGQPDAWRRSRTSHDHGNSATPPPRGTSRQKGRAGIEPATTRLKAERTTLVCLRPACADPDGIGQATQSRVSVAARIRTSVGPTPVVLSHAPLAAWVRRRAKAKTGNRLPAQWLACRHEDSNLGRIYTNGPQPSPFGHLGMAAQYRGQDSNLRKPT